MSTASWARRCLVTANRRSSGATSSRRKAGMTIVRTDLDVLGSVTVSTPWRLWYDLLMRSRELSSMKSDDVSARSSPQRMPVQQSSPKPPHADAISRGRSVRSPVASASSSARRSGPFVLGPSGSPTPSHVVSGHLGGDHSRRSRLPQGTECSRQPAAGSRLQGNLARAHEEIPRLNRPNTRNSLKPEDRQP